MINTEKIWMNGKLVGHDDANIHILSHVVHYGSSVFEGIRIYKTENGPAIFRLREHVKRLFDSAKVYRMDIPYSIEEIEKAIIETVKANKLEQGYIRPIAYRYIRFNIFTIYNCLKIFNLEGFRFSSWLFSFSRIY